MKVLMVSFADGGGGAARAARRLHDALRGAGVDSRMRVRLKSSADPSIDASGRLGALLRMHAGSLPRRLQWGMPPVERSANLLPSRWAHAINQSDADVVHLHWVGADTMSVEDIGRLRKPVVWTLHDMWAFCGAEHLADTGPQARWRLGYDGAAPPGARGFDIDRLVWRRKRASWRRPFLLVTPSRWLGECAGASALLAAWERRTIPNVLDTARFAPAARAAARHALGLGADETVLAFGGGHSDPNKGYDLLLEVLRELERLAPGRRTVCLAFGEERRPAALAGGTVRWLGRLQDDAQLVSLYSAADVALITSRLENFPQAATEAQACGCPVAAFAVGGLPEAVAHGETGVLAAPFEVAALARAVASLAEDRARSLALRANARKRAEQLWSPAVVTAAYLAAYADAAGR